MRHIYYCADPVQNLLISTVNIILKSHIPYLSAYTVHYFALKIRAKSWVRDIRRYPLSRAEFEYCADIYRAQYTRV